MSFGAYVGLRVLCIPDSSDPPSTLQESPTRFPPTRPRTKAKAEDASTKEEDMKSKAGMKTHQKYCLVESYESIIGISNTQEQTVQAL